MKKSKNRSKKAPETKSSKNVTKISTADLKKIKAGCENQRECWKKADV